MPVTDSGKRVQAQLVKELKAFGKRGLKVGLLGPKAAAPHAGGDGLTVADVGAIHEFGLGVPERSFLRGYFDEHANTVAEAARRLIASRGASTQALELLGQFLVGQIQLRIANNIPPALAPATIKRKGSSVALIHTGQLRSAITYRVDPEPRTPVKELAKSARKVAKKIGELSGKASKKIGKLSGKASKRVAKGLKAAKKSTSRAAKKSAKLAARGVKRGVKAFLKKRHKVGVKVQKLIRKTGKALKKRLK